MLQQFNEKNRDLLVNINGQLVHRDKAGISPFDSAVQGGDAGGGEAGPMTRRLSGLFAARTAGEGVEVA